MEILVKKFTASPRFHPHFNRSTNRYYGTQKEYLTDLHAKGLEPVVGTVGEHRPPPTHKPSAWSREMVRTIKRAKQPDGSVQLGSRFYAELHRKQREG